MADTLADFRAFFAGDFQRLLESTEIPGMEGASWDRRAAWLVFNGFNPTVDLIPENPKAIPAARSVAEDIEDLI